VACISFGRGKEGLSDNTCFFRKWDEGKGGDRYGRCFWDILGGKRRGSPLPWLLREGKKREEIDRKICCRVEGGKKGNKNFCRRGGGSAREPLSGKRKVAASN